MNICILFCWWDKSNLKDATVGTKKDVVRCLSLFSKILNAHLYSHLLVQPYLFFFLAEQEVPDGVIPRPTFQLLLSGPDTFAGQIRYI